MPFMREPIASILLLFVILLVRPQGLLGKNVEQKV